MTRSGPVLALETSTGTGSVAVGDGSRLIAETVLSIAGAHSSALLPAIDRVVRGAGLTPGDLTAVVVGGGPGSFTGVRIAAATAKAVVHGLGVPLLAYSSLLATAVAGWASGRPVCALFDARRRDVYAAAYRFAAPPAPAPVEVLLEPVALSVDDLIDRFRGDRPPLFIGEAANLHRDELARELAAPVMPAALGVPRASSLLWLAETVPELGRVGDPSDWEPEYVRAPGAERIAAAAQAGRAAG